jgi:hypothetical protein
MPTPPGFVHGCNYPWSTDGTTTYYGLDFGDNIWGSHLGVSTRRAAVAADFAAMARLGFRVARWFVFCDGRAGIVYDDVGVPIGLDAHFFADLDAALEIALGAGIGLCLVLLDHRWMFRGTRDVLIDPASGTLLETTLPDGRSTILADEPGQDALFTQVFAPVVHRYAAGGRRADLAAAIFAYELMNEPDFIVEEWEQDVSRSVPRPLPFAVLGEQVARLSALVHRHSSAMTTIAAARLRNLWAWDDERFGLDFIQVHSYPNRLTPQQDEDVYGRPATTLGCRRPVVLGEFPGNGPVRHPAWSVPPPWTLDDYLTFAVSSGYGGAWAWSFSGTDAYGPLPEEPLVRFAEANPDLVNRRAVAPDKEVNENEQS